MKRSRRRSLPLGVLLLLAAVSWLLHRLTGPGEQGSTQPRPTPLSSAPQSEYSRSAASSEDYSPSPASGRSAHESQAPLQSDVVVRVTDGDTVKLQRAGTVRLIGVDCPEKAQPGGLEAKAFTRRVLLGKSVELEQCARQPVDRYGRVLGFIYLRDAHGRRVLFNAELVRQGYANVYSLRPCTVDEELWNEYQQEARRANRGLFATLGEVPSAAAFRHRRRSR